MDPFDPLYSEEIFGHTISFCNLNNTSFDLYCYPEYPCEIIDKNTTVYG